MSTWALLVLHILGTFAATTYDRSYPTDSATLGTTATERYYGPKGQLSEPSSMLDGWGYVHVHCPGNTPCGTTYMGITQIDLGSQYFSISSVGAALNKVYSEWTGSGAGMTLGNEYFRPVIWQNDGGLWSSPGTILAIGPEQALTTGGTNWIEWNFDTKLDRVTGYIWVALQHTKGDFGWIFGSTTNAYISGGTFYWSGGGVSDGQTLYPYSSTSVSSAMIYVRAVFNCTRNEQCFGNGECQDTGCKCDWGWRGSNCNVWLIAPPSFDTAAGSVPPDQQVSLTHTSDCAYFCYTTDSSEPQCDAAPLSCKLGTLYETPIVIKSYTNITAVACAQDGQGSTPVHSAYDVSSMWVCQQGSTVNVDLTESIAMAPEYSGTYAANADCVWQVGSSVDGNTATLTFSSWLMDDTTTDHLEVGVPLGAGG